MSKKSNHSDINPDILEEIREILLDAIEERKWINVEEALEIINEELGYDNESIVDSTEANDE
jgi:hypothetical protein